jgi:hypothetical protein
LRQLRRLTGVATTTALICSGLALTSAPARAATPDVAVPLGLSSFQDILVDAAHQHVFVTAGSGGAVLVRDLEGGAVTTIANQQGPAQMTLSPDGTVLYVPLTSGDAISAIDTTTLTETTRYATGASTCPRSVAVTAGKLWFGYGCSQTGGIGVVDLTADGSPVSLAQTPVINYGGAPQLAASPALPNTLFAGESALEKWDASGTGLTAAGSLTGADSTKDIALSTDGSHLLAAIGPSVSSIKTADLSSDGHYASPSGYYTNAVGSSGNGLVAAGFGGGNGNPAEGPLSVFSDTGPRLRAYSFGACCTQGKSTQLQRHGLAFDDTGGRLYAVTADYLGGSSVLHVLHGPGAAVGTMTLTPPSATRGHAFSLKGKITSPSPVPAGSPITVKRDGPGGTVARATVKTAADGSFTITDLINSRGSFGYTATYAGDDSHQPLSKRAVVNVIGTDTTVTIRSSVGPYAYGAKPVLVARLGPSVSRRLSIYVQESFSGSKKILLKTGLVDSHGDLRVSYSARVRTNVIAVFAGDNVYNPRSAVRPFYVRPYFAQRPVGNTGTSGSYALFPHGKTADFLFTLKQWNAYGCLVVEGQQYVSGAWRASDKNDCIRLHSDGTVLVGSFGTNPAGSRWRLRATFLGDTYNVRQTNGWIYYRFT